MNLYDKEEYQEEENEDLKNIEDVENEIRDIFKEINEIRDSENINNEEIYDLDYESFNEEELISEIGGKISYIDDLQDQEDDEVEDEGYIRNEKTNKFIVNLGRVNFQRHAGFNFN